MVLVASLGHCLTTYLGRAHFYDIPGIHANPTAFKAFYVLLLLPLFLPHCKIFSYCSQTTPQIENENCYGRAARAVARMQIYWVGAHNKKFSGKEDIIFTCLF